MIEIGLTKVDFMLLFESWELESAYSEKTAMKLKEEFERYAETFLLEKRRDTKIVKIRFFELGTGCKSWMDTFCSFKFTFQYNDLYKYEGVLKLKVQAIIKIGYRVNISLQEV